MNKIKLLYPALFALLLSNTALVSAKVSPAAASALGKNLTCIGAEAEANAAGTIPAFSGKILGIPEGIEYTKHVGQHPIDPFADDKPILTIDGENWQQYTDNLTAGQKAMFEKYPATFKLPVYQGRRDFRYPDAICDISKRNALEAELVDDGYGFTGYNGSIPFPIPDPSQPLQVLMNHNFPYRAYTYHTVRDIADVSSDGSISWGRQNNQGLNAMTHPDGLGKPAVGVMAYSLTSTELPTRSKGSATATSEPINFARGKRLAWNYNPGTRRVRQLPEYGFDTPLSGTSGKLTIDSDRLFNGSPERYEWELLGKREIYIPANAYRVNSKDVTYDKLLQPGHANPEFLRYELRRVWVLEGKLKQDYRHKYGRRTMYLDEDSWHAIISDYYDTRGELIQHAFINYYYAFDANAYESGASFYHDLTTGGYVGYNLFQERPLGPILNKGNYTPVFFTPAALRRKSH